MADESEAGRPPVGRVGRLLREPTVPVLLLVAVVQVVRRSAVDVAIFVGVAVLVVWDGRRRRDRPARRPWWPGVPAAVAVALAYAVLVGRLGRSGPAVQAALALPGLVALGVVLAARPPDPANAPVPSRSRVWLAWPVLALTLAVLELGAFLSQSDPLTDNPAHPTVSTTVEPLLDGVGARSVALGVWLLVGWWLVRAVLAAAAAPEGKA